MESEKVAYATSQPDSQERDTDKKTYSVDVNDNEHDHDSEDPHAILDNKFPFPKLHGLPEEGSQITLRALLIGCCLGAVVSASNIYLGLKTGWTFGASLFGSILGFAILKPISNFAGKRHHTVFCNCCWWIGYNFRWCHSRKYVLLTCSISY